MNQITNIEYQELLRLCDQYRVEQRIKHFDKLVITLSSGVPAGHCDWSDGRPAMSAGKAFAGWFAVSECGRVFVAVGIGPDLIATQWRCVDVQGVSDEN